jgi:hypothetical protein
MESLIETLRCFNTYLAGTDSNALTDRMRYYDNELFQFKHDFYTVTIDSSPQITELILALLKHLNIPPHQWYRYLGTSLTVYDFLVELREHNGERIPQVNEIIDHIYVQVSSRLKKITYGGLILLATVEGSLPFLATFGGLTALHGLIAAALFAPIVGTIFTLAVAGYSIYKNFHNTKIPFLQRMQNHFFLLAQSALKFAGYGILIAAATTSSPVVAILLTVSATVVVMKELASLARMVIQDKQNHPLAADASLSERQYYARYDLEYIRRRNDILIDIVTAVISVGIVAVWSFMPGGIFIVVAAIAAIGILFIAEQLAHKYNKKVINNRLQSQFEALELADQQKQVLSPTVECIDKDEEQQLNDRTIPPLAVQPRLQRSNLQLSRPSQNGMFSAGERVVSRGNSQLNAHDDLEDIFPTANTVLT